MDAAQNALMPVIVSSRFQGYCVVVEHMVLGLLLAAELALCGMTSSSTGKGSCCVRGSVSVMLLRCRHMPVIL